MQALTEQVGVELGAHTVAVMTPHEEASVSPHPLKASSSLVEISSFFYTFLDQGLFWMTSERGGCQRDHSNLNCPRSHWPVPQESNVMLLEAALASASERSWPSFIPLCWTHPYPEVGVKQKYSGRDILAESCCQVR